MNQLVHADLFFIISSAAVILITAAVIIGAVYVIRILRKIEGVIGYVTNLLGKIKKGKKKSK
jgi:hypothetical protein